MEIRIDRAVKTESMRVQWKQNNSNACMIEYSQTINSNEARDKVIPGQVYICF